MEFRAKRSISSLPNAEKPSLKSSALDWVAVEELNLRHYIFGKPYHLLHIPFMIT